MVLFTDGNPFDYQHNMHARRLLDEELRPECLVKHTVKIMAIG